MRSTEYAEPPGSAAWKTSALTRSVALESPTDARADDTRADAVRHSSTASLPRDKAQENRYIAGSRVEGEHSQTQSL